MRHIVYDKTTGDIVQVVTCPAAEAKLYLTATTATIPAGNSVVDAMSCVDVVTRQLKVRTPSVSEQWLAVTRTRDNLLTGSDSTIATIMLPDSFPAMTKASKDALVLDMMAYRKALRDITLQKDPTTIVWPTPPVI